MTKEKENNEPKRITNQEFSKTDNQFIEACTNANVTPTQRQASRFRMKKGIAYKTMKGGK